MNRTYTQAFELSQNLESEVLALTPSRLQYDGYDHLVTLDTLKRRGRPKKKHYKGHSKESSRYATLNHVDDLLGSRIPPEVTTYPRFKSATDLTQTYNLFSLPELVFNKTRANVKKHKLVR